MAVTRDQKYRAMVGCLLGGVLGDAWGGPFEGAAIAASAEFPAIPRVSDDTWLTVATCRAISESGGKVDPATIAHHLCLMYQANRVPGVGAATLKALRDLSMGAHWALSGARGEFAAGSGAAMRIAPLAFVLDPEPSTGRAAVRDVARITHHNDEAYAGALAVVIAVRCCWLAKAVPSDLMSLVHAQLPDTAVRDRFEALANFEGSPGQAAERFGRSGYAVEVVPLAVFVATALCSASLQDVVRTSVALGGDADTIAAIAGQIVGAATGEVAEARMARVESVNEIRQDIEKFAGVVRASRA